MRRFSVLLSVLLITSVVSAAPGAGADESLGSTKEPLGTASVSSRLVRAHDLAAAGTPAPAILEAEPTLQLSGTSVEIEISFNSLDSAVATAVEAAGLDVTGTWFEYGMMTGFADLSDLDAIASVPEVATIYPLPEPETSAGSVTSQADTSINVDDARYLFGVDGTGIDVGVISDS